MPFEYCENGYRISIIFVGYENVNGTTKPVFKLYIEECPADPGPIVAAAFLTILLILSLVLHILVIVTISTSYTLKKNFYCFLIVNLSAVCIIDCIFNAGIAVGYVSLPPWRYGYYVCYFNSFMINFVNNQMALSIFLLVIDRFLVAKKYAPYLSLKIFKLNITVAVTWLVSFLLASPLVCGYMESMPYRSRYSCTVTDQQDDFYLIAHFAGILILISATMITCCVLTVLIFHKEKRKKRKVKGNKSFKYIDQILMTPYYRNEFYPSFFVLLLLVGYFVLWFPFTVLTTVNPMITSDWKNNTALQSTVPELSKLEKDTIIRSKAFISKAVESNVSRTAINDVIINDSSVKNSTTNTTISFIPEIVNTPLYETAFVWLHFIFDLIVPILIFFIIKDIKKKSLGLLFCFKGNVVDVASPKPILPPYFNKSLKGSDLKSDSKDKKKKSVALTTPILFATSEGLHIRTIASAYLSNMDSKPRLGLRHHSPTPEYNYDLCDLVLGYEDDTDNKQEEYNVESVDMNGDLIVVTKSVRPPTPPKHKTEDIFDDTIELKPLNKKIGEKQVRFNSKLNQVIPKSGNGSAGSSESADSGIAQKNEANSPPKPRKLSFSKENNGMKKKTPGIGHNNLRGRVVPVQKKPLRKSPSPEAPKKHFSKHEDKNSKKKIRNIKSRHFREINGSLVSLNS